MNILDYFINIGKKILSNQPLSIEEQMITTFSSLFIGASLIPYVIAAGVSIYDLGKKNKWW